MIHGYLLVGNFVICFWINLVLNIAFDTCSVFDLICLFWINSVYLLCSFRRNFFSIGIDIVGVSRRYTDHYQGRGHSIRPTAAVINIH